MSTLIAPAFADLGLIPPLLKAIEGCGYQAPTPVQVRAVPAALAGRDLIASANTGTGKTAAFVLPALQRLALNQRPVGSFGPRILILSPTRELASQSLEAVRRYSKFSRVNTGVIVGGMPYREQRRLLERRVDIIVATPGRLIDHLDRAWLDLSSVEFLVLDEADRMLDLGFLEPVEKIAAACPASRQTLLFTATVDAPMVRLAARLLRDPERIDIAGRQVAHEAIEQRLLRADDLDHKHRLLTHLAGCDDVAKAIVFAATKRDADRLAEDLGAKGHAAAALHGDMSQPQRNRTLDALRRGRIRLLVATDVAARGLDVADITHVINFDLPRVAEDYVHRIGRTGRAGASGIAYSFYTGKETGQVRAIERFLGKPLPAHTIPGLEPRAIVRRPSPPAVAAARKGPPPRTTGSRKAPGAEKGDAPILRTGRRPSA
ncbi:MAG: DEAD/DEAH box helicase [Rhodospirillaceae bacterium]